MTDEIRAAIVAAAEGVCGGSDNGSIVTLDEFIAEIARHLAPVIEARDRKIAGLIRDMNCGCGKCRAALSLLDDHVPDSGKMVGKEEAV